MATRQLGWFGSLILGAGIIGAGYFVAHLAMNAYHMGQASEAWPTVQGSVIHSNVATRHNSKGTMYSADVQFAYRFGGKEYKSNKIDASPGSGVSSSSDSSEAHETVNRYQTGQAVTVHYNPSKPWVGVLEPGVSTMTWAMFGMGGFLMFIGGWIALSGISRVLLGVGMLGVLTFAWLKRDK